MESPSLYPALIEEKVKQLMVLIKESSETRNILELFHEEKRQLFSQFYLQADITGVNNCNPARGRAGDQCLRESTAQQEFLMPHRSSFDGNRYRSSSSIDEKKRSAYYHINKKNRREVYQQDITTGEIRESLYTDANANANREWDGTRKTNLSSCISTSTAAQNSTEGGYDSSSQNQHHGHSNPRGSLIPNLEAHYYVKNQYHGHSNRRGSFPNFDMLLEEDSDFDDSSCITLMNGNRNHTSAEEQHQIDKFTKINCIVTCHFAT